MRVNVPPYEDDMQKSSPLLFFSMNCTLQLVYPAVLKVYV